jgi:hypothetical protein
MRVIDIRLSSIHNMHWMSEFVHLIDSEYYISVTLQIVMDLGSCFARLLITIYVAEYKPLQI